MSTYTRIIYQVVYTTKHRHPCLHKAGRPELFRYITGILEKQRCKVYAIGGVEDHLHLLFSLHPTVALSRLVKDIKIATALHIKETGHFPAFDRWQPGYGAFTYSREAVPNLIRYVLNQETHHRQESSRAELQRLLQEQEVTYRAEYLV